jgi:hypothetical protein
LTFSIVFCFAVTSSVFEEVGILVPVRGLTTEQSTKKLSVPQHMIISMIFGLSLRAFIWEAESSKVLLWERRGMEARLIELLGGSGTAVRPIGGMEARLGRLLVVPT